MNNNATATNATVNNLSEFAKELSMIIDQSIGLDHIHADGRRFYYTQAAIEMSPMLLHHYRGPFFVDMHPEDLRKLKTGEISAHDYIHKANWLVGYYWGGGSMVGGGYYQPMDIIGNQDEVRKYLKILSCRGITGACHYMPSEEKCAKCPLTECWFSEHKEGNREDDIPEPDPRHDLFNAFLSRFEKEYPDYTLRGFLCSDSLEDDQAFVSANGHYSEDDPYSFRIYASDNVIRSILMHTVTPEDWDEYAATFKFVMKVGEDYRHEVTPETLAQAADENDYEKKWKKEEEERARLAAEDAFDFDTPVASRTVGEAIGDFFKGIVDFFKNIF